MDVFRRPAPLLRWLLPLFFGLVPVFAATIDVSTTETAVLAHDDTLLFAISASNYGPYADRLAAPSWPEDIFISLLTAPLDSTAQFSAALLSANRQNRLPFGDPLQLAATWFSGERYQGPASIVYGFEHLTDAQSRAFFGSSAAFLELRNLGPDVVLGLPGYTLSQDLNVSLLGGNLTVGAKRLSVPSSDTPEPGSAALLIAAGSLLCLAGVLLKRCCVLTHWPS
jgi:hypothetical protein